ncbi:MAG: hypothetical protein ACRCTY_01690, partial [Candidatus Adiutrix sp.]
MTKEKIGSKGEGRIYANADEVRMAYDAEALGLQAKITVRINGKREETTCGRVLLSEIIPPSLVLMLLTN